ncbi:unnamed protein product, partial [Brenthis ino]
MSIFKIKQWWSNDKSQSAEYDDGIQNSNCIKADKFESHKDSDCLIIGQGSLLNIYKPTTENKNPHPILETNLNEIILQVETGKFVADSADRQILLLHPNSYVVYFLKRIGGHVDVGEQNSLTDVIKHSFIRRAASVISGPFGASKGRDLICIQAMDGTLSFFDQDTFLFMCVFNDIIIPGPICYTANSDQFVICKSTWIMEIFSFQQLNELSELSIRQNKKNIPQWSFNPGEEIISLQTVRTSNNFSTIVAIGERHLYCFQDNGLMKYMIKFDYMPICFHAYLIGWYYEPNSRLLIMVASEDSKLNIYEGTSLLWSCDLMHKVISIARCYLNSLSGGILTLSTEGVVNVSYLGTEPDLNASGNAMNDIADANQIQAELDIVEESLKKIMDAKGEVDEEDIELDHLMKIKIDVGNLLNKPITDFSDNRMRALQTCPLIIIITCENPKLIQSLQITYYCIPPIVSLENTQCLDEINGTEILENYLFLFDDGDVSDCGLNIEFTVVQNNGKIHIFSRRLIIPINFYCVPTEIVMENDFKINISTNRPALDFVEIFSDFTRDELINFITENMLTLKYRTSDNTVTLKISENMYSIEANDFMEMSPVIDYIINFLKSYHEKQGASDFSIHCIVNGELIKQIIHAFLKSIEGHAKERVKLKNLEEELNILQRQFTLVQKRLLVQYGSLPPGNCDPLEFLMYDTHERIKMAAYGMIQSKQNVLSAGNNLRRYGSLIVHILKQTVTDNLKLKLIEEMLALDTLNGQFQEWEEAVAQGLSYILNKIFKKSDKDKEKLAPVIDQGILSQTNLKKLLKQLRIMFEKVFADQNIEEKGKITRIEEFVEVI